MCYEKASCTSVSVTFHPGLLAPSQHPCMWCGGPDEFSAKKKKKEEK